MLSDLLNLILLQWWVSDCEVESTLQLVKGDLATFFLYEVVYEKRDF